MEQVLLRKWARIVLPCLHSKQPCVRRKCSVLRLEGLLPGGLGICPTQLGGAITYTWEVPASTPSS